MIIVSQNRKFMINFDNVQSIGVDNDINYKNYYINFVVGSGDGTLGNYKTEERAKEVLQEILNTIIGNKSIEIYSNEMEYELTPVYYMPLE